MVDAVNGNTAVPGIPQVEDKSKPKIVDDGEVSNTRRSIQNLTENFDNFLKLLTVQLQNQDPTEPLDSNEFTNQIVAFSQVEQTVGINERLDGLSEFIEGSTADFQDSFSANSTQTQDTLAKLLDSSRLSNPAVFYIGKEIEAEGNLVTLENGKANLVFDVAKEANATLSVQNEKGQTIWTQNLTKVSGRNTVQWDGKDVTGAEVTDGVYTFTVSALDADGEVDARTLVSGIATGAQYVQDGAMLNVGDLLVPLGAITGVRDAPVAANTNTPETTS